MGSRRCRFLFLIVVCAVAVSTTSVDRVAPPVALAQAASGSGKIAFTSNRDGNDEIYVMNADGTSVARLTNDPASDQQPAWSPDGSRIAFTSSRSGKFEIYVMNADGTGVARLTTTTTQSGSTRPAWCGNRIAFESDRSFEFFADIFAMNDDGTALTRLTTDNTALERQPAWSPTCDRLAFTKDPMANAEIYVMNADGTGTSRITNSLGSDRDPAWSPDGARIAFSSTRADAVFYETYLVNADGTAATRLTDSAGSNSRPAWSQDGNKVAFVSSRDGDDEIFVVNADGTGVTQLTNNTFSDRDAAWSEALPAEIGAWPNEPTNFATFNDQPWNDLAGGWGWLRRGSSKDPDIFAEATAPFSPQNVLRMIFTPDMANNTDSSVHWLGLPGSDEIYTGWWMKLSSNWTPTSSAATQISYLYGGGGGGHVFTSFTHPCVWPDQCSPEVEGPPYKITATTNWDASGRILYPNVTATPINPGEWHRIEFYYRWETTPGISGDGIIRWWVDGTLNGNYTAIHYPSQRGFLEFQYAPNREFATAEEQYMYIDHTRISVR